MAGTLSSLYSAATTAFVPTDKLASKAPALGAITMVQSVSGEVRGKNEATVNWTIPTQNEVVSEFLGTGTGAAQTLETRYDPIVAASETVYEVTGLGAGSTTLALAATDDKDIISVASATNFSVGDWLLIEEGTKKNYYKISAINATLFTLTSRIDTVWDSGTSTFVTGGFTTSATVKNVTISALKAEITDYVLTDATGVFSIVAGQFTNTQDIIVAYDTTLQDLQDFQLFRHTAQVTPLAGYSGVTIAAVTGAGGAQVGSNITSVSTSNVDTTLVTANNGETYYYYLFARDFETSPNVSFGSEFFVETMPTIPQALSTTVGDAEVILSWDNVQTTSGADTNTDGYNVTRANSSTFSDASAYKLNSVLIAVGTTSFTDSANNVTNRVASAGFVLYPVNGQSYSYKVESEDTATSWTTGTNNQTAAGAAVTTASK